MNSEGIRTFIMLSKLKNFTRTAERMYVAQSTVTNRIAELENETGKKLFVRRQGGVELTEEGKLFLSYAQRINELEESFVREVNAAARYEKRCAWERSMPHMKAVCILWCAIFFIIAAMFL